MADGEIKIEKGVPIPDTGSGRPRIYPWAGMKKGDSFFVPTNGRSHELTRTIVIAAARAHFKVTTRKENDGIRVWRIE